MFQKFQELLRSLSRKGAHAGGDGPRYRRDSRRGRVASGMGDRGRGLHRGRRSERRLAAAETLEQRSLMAADLAVDVGTDAAAGLVASVGPSVVARIVNGTPTSDYGSVGIIGDASGGFCSGTLIAPRYALTAAHCAEGVANTAGRFNVGGQNYATSRVVVHPNYNNQSLANDIAIYELNQAVTGVTPSPIFRGTPQVGQQLTLVGFGAGGTGTTGHTNDFGTKRVGRTPIDGVEPTVIRWNFDNNTESNTAPGDSGGPAFVTVNQVDYVAGVTSGGNRDDAGIGDQSFDTRVDAFATWIDSIVGGSTTPPPPPPPPPPSGDDHANAPGSSATVVALNSTGDGTAQGALEIAGDRDVFQFTVLKAGAAVITTSAGASGLDTYLRIYNSAGTLVGQNDDYNQTLNSQVSLSVQPGVYYASVGSYQDAGVGAYQLSVKVTAATTGDKFSSAVAIPLAPDGTGAVNSSISSTATGRVFSFVAQFTGQFIATTRATSGNLDTILNAYDAGARRVATNDDYGGSLNSRVQFNVVVGSKYYLEVGRYGQTTGNFTLNLTNTNTTRARSGAETGRAAVTTVSSGAGASPSADGTNATAGSTAIAAIRPASGESRRAVFVGTARTVGNRDVNRAAAALRSSFGRAASDRVGDALSNVEALAAAYRAATDAAMSESTDWRRRW